MIAYEQMVSEKSKDIGANFKLLEKLTVSKMKFSNQSRNILWIILASSTLTVMAGAMIGPVINLIREGLSVSASEAGMIITTHGIFIFLLSPVVGNLIDRTGTKTPFVVGLLLYGLAGGSGLFIDDYIILLISRAFLGIGAALIYTSVTVLILNLYEGNQRNRVMGWRGSANSLGAAFWPLIGGTLGTVSWHLPFGVYLTGIPLGIIALFTIPEIGENEIEGEVNSDSILFIFRRSPILFGIYGLMLLANLMLYVNVIYLPQTLEKVSISSSLHISLFLSALGIAAGGTASQYDKIRSKLVYSKIIPITLSLWTIGFILISQTSNFWIYGISVLLFGTGQGLVLPTVMLWVGDIIPKSFLGRFTSYIATFGFMGQFLAPILFSPVLNILGLKGIFLTAAGICLIILFLSVAYHVACSGGD